MRQRVVIATALANEPALLIADEPTTALDVTIQAQVLDLLRDLRRTHRTTILLITHDLGVVAQLCDRVGVMYAGQLVEVAPVEEHLPRAAASVHPGAPRGPARRRPGARRPPRDRGPGARSDGCATRLPVHTSMPVPDARVRPRAAARRRAGRPLHRVLAVERDPRRRRRGSAPTRELGRNVGGRGERVSATAVEPTPDVAREERPLLRVEGLVKRFPVQSGMFRSSAQLHAVAGVDLEVAPGEVLAVVGESGSGKSTLARCILRLLDPTAGRIVFDDVDVTSARGKDLEVFRRRVQPVFQDPFSSLDPRWTVGRSVREALDAQALGTTEERAARVADLLDRVGLHASLADRRPHELSGGQRQRVGIAAALAPSPALIVADEPVSALDVSVQAQVLNLLAELQRDLGLAILFVAHDLSVVRHISHRVAVMYLGRIVETGATEAVFGDPQHPYTQALLGAIPVIDPSRRLRPAELAGEIPSPIAPPTGCRFHTRCPVAIARCTDDDPEMTDFGGGHRAACHVARARLDEPA